MLGSRQADGLDVIGVGDGTVQLHQGDVVVIGVCVVVGVGYDLLQGLLHHGTSNLTLGVKAEVSFPGGRLVESEHTPEQMSSFSIQDNQ